MSLIFIHFTKLNLYETYSQQYVENLFFAK